MQLKFINYQAVKMLNQRQFFISQHGIFSNFPNPFNVSHKKHHVIFFKSLVEDLKLFIYKILLNILFASK